MGYFNYFIKCVIRKFVNMIFKPKMFLALLIIIGLLFAMQITSRAEWTDTQIQDLQTQLTQVTAKLDNLIVNTGWISTDVTTLRNTLGDIKGQIDSLLTYSGIFQDRLNEIVSQLGTVSAEITNIYNQLEENQQELLATLEEDNQAVLEELNMIRDAINGTEEELTTYNDLGIISSSSGSDFTDLKCISIDYEPRYSYKIKVYYTNTWDTTLSIRVNPNDNKFENGYTYVNEDFIYLGTVPANSSSFVFNYNIPSSNPKYLYFTWGEKIEKIEVYRSIKGIVESLNDSNSLQQQQNQLQQEQNDFLKDDNVNTDGLEFATDDTVNPTSEGFDTLFNTIYNAFCNTSSQPLTITLPFINKTFTIQPNIVSNGMQQAGLGVIVTLINSFYYFSVCLFIYKDIGKIVDNLKSGNITSDCGNVKTEVL